jgi:hypothetical protein
MAHACARARGEPRHHFEALRVDVVKSELADRFGAGDHEIAVGRVIGGRILDREANPMVYAQTGAMDGSRTLYPASF